MKFLFLFLFFFLTFVSISFSKTCVRYDSNGNKIYYACPKPSEKKYRFQWDVRTTRQDSRIVKKEILTSTVCSQYQKGDIDYRRCRRQAQEHFGNKCSTLGDDTSIDRDMFCDAERDLKYSR